MEKGIQNPAWREGCFYPVCFITKISRGRFKIEYSDDLNDNQTPNKMIIAYPSGIESIIYSKN